MLVKSRLTAVALALAALFVVELWAAAPAAANQVTSIIKKNGPIASSSYLACIANLRKQGLSWAQIQKECEQKLVALDKQGFNIGGPIATNKKPFDARTIQAACNAGADPRVASGGQNCSGLYGQYGCYTWGDHGPKGLNKADAEKAKSEAISGALDALGEYLAAGEELNEANKEREAAAEHLQDAQTAGTNTDVKNAEDRLKKAEDGVKAAETKQENALHKLQKAENKAKADPNGSRVAPEPDTLPPGQAVARTNPESTCSKVLDSARELLFECHRTGWKDFRCQRLNARVKRCPDPAQILVDPDQGYSCGPPEVSFETFTAVFKQLCQRRTKPGPGADPCAPPKPIEGTTIAEPEGSGQDPCNDPYALSDPEGAGCFVPLRVGGPKEVGSPGDINDVIVWGQGVIGGPIVVLPLPKPKLPGTPRDPRPGPRSPGG